MITFVTMQGKTVYIRSSADQDEFEKAIAKDPEKASFYVGRRKYYTRCIAQWTPRTRRGPYARRGRITA